MLLDERQPFVSVGQALVLDEFAKENVAPDRPQPEGDRVEDQPEDDVFRCYFNRLPLSQLVTISISQVMGDVHNNLIWYKGKQPHYLPRDGAWGASMGIYKDPVGFAAHQQLFIRHTDKLITPQRTHPAHVNHPS